MFDISNDTRGWILCVISAVACVAGACIVCVDVFIRMLPGKKHFDIQDSSAFLSASLSLSFGVMIFSSLFSMLPSAKRYLVKDGRAEQTAGLLMMGSFAVGFVGMQVISRIIHRFMPSHVVDCDHSHDDEAESPTRPPSPATAVAATETTPLLPRTGSSAVRIQRPATASHEVPLAQRSLPSKQSLASMRRPSMVEIQKRVLSFVKDVKSNCDESGLCFGYTDPCGQECKRIVALRTPDPLPTTPADAPAHGIHAAGTHEREHAVPVSMPEPETLDDHHSHENGHSHHGHGHHEDSDVESGIEHLHHHHVPANAFLSIGLQTVLAIGLHKFPEGFIAFATNHANPTLGFNVFLALFVHNIAEGFAMALPLYMALGSRFKAILWAAALGGLSQPLGAGVAALWLTYLGRNSNHGGEGDGSDLDTAYGVLFAVTAGIMVAVALQLFVESLTLHHNRQLTLGFAFVGMMMLGLSNAIGAH